MKNKVISVTVCALAIGFLTTGCSNTAWAIKSGNVTIPTGVYAYYLLSNASSVYQQANNATTTTTANKTITLPWAQKIDNEPATTWAINNAILSCEEVIFIEQQCAARKITLTASEEASAKSKADSSYGSYESLFTKNGIGETSVERTEEATALSNKLFDSYYGTGGDKAVSETDLDNYYTKNYVHVKEIFINTEDSSGKALTGAKLTAATNKANEAYSDATQDKSDFDSLVKKYNEDSKMTSNPDGYIFSKTTAQSQSLDQNFIDLAFSLKVGSVGKVQSGKGIFIVYKVPVDPKASTFNSQKESILSALKGTEYSNFVKSSSGKLKIEKNSSTFSHFTPESMNLSTSS